MFTPRIGWKASCGPHSDCLCWHVLAIFTIFITIMATVIVMTFVAVILRTSYCNVFLLSFCDERIDRPDTAEDFFTVKYCIHKIIMNYI